MASLNKVQLIGYLGGTPEKKITASGASVVSVSMATTNHYKDQMGQSQSTTDWHRLVFWGALADNVAMYTQKGSLVYVEGRLQTREWTKDDIRRYTTEIVVGRCQFLDRKQKDSDSYGAEQHSDQNHSNNFTPNNQQKNDNSATTGNTNVATNQGNEDFVEDDIPF